MQSPPSFAINVWIFPTSQRYDQGALAELVKMGAKKQRLVRMDEHDLIFNMLQHTNQHEAENENIERRIQANTCRLEESQTV